MKGPRPLTLLTNADSPNPISRTRWQKSKSPVSSRTRPIEPAGSWHNGSNGFSGSGVIPVCRTGILRLGFIDVQEKGVVPPEFVGRGCQFRSSRARGELRFPARFLRVHASVFAAETPDTIRATLPKLIEASELLALRIQPVYDVAFPALELR